MTRICCLAAALLLGAGAEARAQTEPAARARALAEAGRRTEAIALLEGALAAAPRNHDARTALGTILSWEQRYDDARRELETVLRAIPAHVDALTALINVELWSSHPQQADLLAQRGLQIRPADTGYLLSRARALVAMKRPAEAASVLDQLLVVDPRDQQALTLRRTVAEARRRWQARAGASHDRYNDRGDQREAQISLSRDTPAGPVLVRGSRAERYGLTDHQIELEMYPRIRRGTYAYVAAAYGPDAVLYPRRRYAGELYQSLGGGFEASAGIRRLSFGDGVMIYVGSLSKYYGPWLFTGRVYLTPGEAGTSHTLQGSLRRYLGDSGAYGGLRYSRGAMREELLTVDDYEVLDAHAAGADTVWVLARRLELTVSLSYSREDRVDRPAERRVSLSSGLGFRF